jgi:septal ring factor EnvC (AmiA/AmiB activator)
MLTDEQRIERDVTALQVELLDVEKQIADLSPILQEKNKNFQEARAHFEVDKLRLKLLKDRRSALQSVLKSLPRE